MAELQVYCYQIRSVFASVLKALTHYNDFHKDFSEKIVGKIVVLI